MGDKISFLIVDDDALMRHALQTLLAPHGAVTEARSTAEARALRREEWCAAVIDVRLRDGSGLQVLEAWRSQGWDTPAVIFAGESDTAMVERAMAARARVVEKPDAGALLASMADAIEETQTHPALAITMRTRLRFSLTAAETSVLQNALEDPPPAVYRAAKKIALTTYKSQVKALLHKIGHPDGLRSLTATLWKEEAERAQSLNRPPLPDA